MRFGRCLGVVFVGASSLCGCRAAAPLPHGTPQGPIVRVDRGPLERKVAVDGTLYSPSSKPVIVERVRWYWDYNVAWTADEGSMVKKGDPIVRLDPSTIEKDLTLKQNELEQARLKLEEEKVKAQDSIADALADVTTNEFNLKKAKLLVTNDDSVSANEKQKERLEVAAAEAALARSHERVAATKIQAAKGVRVQDLQTAKAQEEVDALQEGLSKMVLRAPQDGLLLFPLYSGSSGWQKASPGAAVHANNIVAEVANPNDLLARVYVPEVDAEGIKIGVPATVTLDVASGKVYQGKVSRVASVPSTPADRDGTKSTKPADNVRQFEVLINLDQKPMGVTPGMTVRAELVPVHKTEVLRVPLEVLAANAPAEPSRGKPSAADNAEALPDFAPGDQAYVYMQSIKGGPWQWRTVHLGLISLSFAEITAGLEVGDQVRALTYSL